MRMANLGEEIILAAATAGGFSDEFFAVTITLASIDHAQSGIDSTVDSSASSKPISAPPNQSTETCIFVLPNCRFSIAAKLPSIFALSRRANVSP